MRHLKDGRKFGRSPASRRAMFRNLAMNFILRERIVTTDAKAKELRRIAERLVTVAKRADGALGVDPKKLDIEKRTRRLAIYRQLRSYLSWEAFEEDGTETDVVGKLMDEIAPRYLKRPGGYTRIMKMANRHGDNAAMSAIEWLPVEAPKKKERKTGKDKDGALKRVSKFFSRSKKDSTASPADKPSK